MQSLALFYCIYLYSEDVELGLYYQGFVRFSHNKLVKKYPFMDLGLCTGTLPCWIRTRHSLKCSLLFKISLYPEALRFLLIGTKGNDLNNENNLRLKLQIVCFLSVGVNGRSCFLYNTGMHLFVGLIVNWLWGCVCGIVVVHGSVTGCHFI